MSRPRGSKNKPKIDTPLSVPFVLDSIEPQDVGECPIATVEGWANLCTSTFKVLGKQMQGYYLGSDIHKTIDEAKKVAGTTAVGQVYIRWCDTRKKE